MNKLISATLIAAIVLLAAWIYRLNEFSEVEQDRLKSMEESQEKLQGSIQRILASLEKLDHRVGLLERRPLEPTEPTEAPDGATDSDNSDESASTFETLIEAAENHTVLDDGTIVFDKGAAIELLGGFVLSSPSGSMRSDAERTMIYGDLVLEGSDGQRITGVALITDPSGKWSMTLKEHPEFRDLDLENLGPE